jgi:hypothetical protein
LLLPLFIRVLECKFNLDGLLKVNKELIIKRIKNIVSCCNKKKYWNTIDYKIECMNLLTLCVPSSLNCEMLDNIIR